MCIPNGVKMGEIVKIVMNYLDAHPEQLHLSARNAVLDSISLAFPCQK